MFIALTVYYVGNAVVTFFVYRSTLSKGARDAEARTKEASRRIRSCASGRGLRHESGAKEATMLRKNVFRHVMCLVRFICFPGQSIIYSVAHYHRGSIVFTHRAPPWWWLECFPSFMFPVYSFFQDYDCFFYFGCGIVYSEPAAVNLKTDRNLDV